MIIQNNDNQNHNDNGNDVFNKMADILQFQEMAGRLLKPHSIDIANANLI